MPPQKHWTGGGQGKVREYTGERVVSENRFDAINQRACFRASPAAPQNDGEVAEEHVGREVLGRRNWGWELGEPSFLLRAELDRLKQEPACPDDQESRSDRRMFLEFDRGAGDPKLMGLETVEEELLSPGRDFKLIRCNAEDEASIVQEWGQKLFEPVHGSTCPR